MVGAALALKRQVDPRAPEAVRTLTAFAVTIAPIDSQSAGFSDWRRTMRPIIAAKTGLTLI